MLKKMRTSGAMLAVIGAVALVCFVLIPQANAQNTEPLLEAVSHLEARLQQLSSTEAGDQGAALQALSHQLAALRHHAGVEDQKYAALYGQAEALTKRSVDGQEPDYQAMIEEMRTLVADLKAFTERRDDDTEAAPTLTLSGQIRHRSEVNDKVALEGSDAPRYHLLRTRFNISFAPIEEVTVFVQVQDSRLFGGQDVAQGRGTLDGNADALDFHQAYFAVDNLFGTAFNVKVGRQELAYGN